MSVAEACALSPTEYQGWIMHLRRYPPAETVLAALWLNVSRALGATAEPQHMGYWLESPRMRGRREENERRERRRLAAEMTREAYLRSKADG